MAKNDNTTVDAKGKNTPNNNNAGGSNSKPRQGQKPKSGFRLSEISGIASVLEEAQKRISQRAKEKKERKRAQYMERKRQKEQQQQNVVVIQSKSQPATAAECKEQ